MVLPSQFDWKASDVAAVFKGPKYSAGASRLDIPEHQLLGIVQPTLRSEFIETRKGSLLRDAGPVREQAALADRLDRLNRQERSLHVLRHCSRSSGLHMQAIML